MEGIEPRSIDSGRAVLHQPFSGRLKRVEEDCPTAAHADLENWPSILPRPILSGGGMISPKLVKVASQKLSIGNFWNAIDLGNINIKEIEVHQEGSNYHQNQCEKCYWPVEAMANIGYHDGDGFSQTTSSSGRLRERERNDKTCEDMIKHAFLRAFLERGDSYSRVNCPIRA
jgi:hypothetical protein